MKEALLLDTHVVLWMLQGSLNAAAKKKIIASASLVVSHVTFWEISIKASLGKLPDITATLEETLRSDAVRLLPIHLPHIQYLKQLPPHHRDPFDRMLIAQACCEGMTIMTADRMFQGYDLPLIVV